MSPINVSLWLRVYKSELLFKVLNQPFKILLPHKYSKNERKQRENYFILPKKNFSVNKFISRSLN